MFDLIGFAVFAFYAVTCFLLWTAIQNLRQEGKADPFDYAIIAIAPIILFVGAITIPLSF